MENEPITLKKIYADILWCTLELDKAVKEERYTDCILLRNAIQELNLYKDNHEKYIRDLTKVNNPSLN